jgi:hypothetical protein
MRKLALVIQHDPTIHLGNLEQVLIEANYDLTVVDARSYAFDARLAATPSAASDEIRVLPADSNERVGVPLASIKSLAFTGKDAASGKSWESWIRRYAEKKLAGEAANIESEAL